MDPATQPPYPVRLAIDRGQRINQLWGIPIFGIMARALLAIPHFIVLWFYAIVVALVTLITWFGVLTRGEYPRWGYEIIGGYLRWTVRVQAYVGLMAAPYPPFSARPGGYPVDVTFDEGQRLNRLWGIPLLGIAARAILAIPHAIIVWVLGIAVALSYLVLWFGVLVNGRFPEWGYDLVGGTVRWSTRMTAWILLMAGPYPPFRLDD
ncbi:MAG: DUF4389 domain-containing protein [Candidatus Limnocylindria bacterium]